MSYIGIAWSYIKGAFKLTDADIAAVLAESPYTDD